MKKVIITGGTGLIGQALAQYLIDRGNDVTVLSRRPPLSIDNNGIHYAAWDPDNGKIDRDLVCNSDFVIHLAGAGIMDKRWSSSYKKLILDSRVKASATLLSAISADCKIKAIISASAIGWYGADEMNGHPFIESDPAADDFLGETCRHWEQSIETKLVRVCKIRTGIVLSENGGAMDEFKKPLRFGIAAIPGSGKQILSWIHLHDLCRIYEFAMENENMNGSINAVSPSPVRLKEFILALANKQRGKFYQPIHVPGFALRIALGEAAGEILKSATVSAEKIRSAGFTFLFPSIKSALNNL